jgi:hypothetical protein
VFEVGGVKLRGLEEVQFSPEGKLTKASLAQDHQLTDSNASICLRQGSAISLHANGKVEKGTLCQTPSSFFGLALKPASLVEFHANGMIKQFEVEGQQQLNIPGIGRIAIGRTVEVHPNGRVASVFPAATFSLPTGATVRAPEAKLSFYQNGQVESVYLDRSFQAAPGLQLENQVTYTAEGSLRWSNQTKNTRYTKDAFTCFSTINSVIAFHSNQQILACSGTYSSSGLLLTSFSDAPMVGHATGRIALGLAAAQTYQGLDIAAGAVTMHPNGALRSAQVSRESSYQGVSFRPGPVYFWHDGKPAYGISATTQRVNGRWFAPGDVMILTAAGVPSTVEAVKTELIQAWTLDLWAINNSQITKYLTAWDVIKSQ